MYCLELGTTWLSFTTPRGTYLKEGNKKKNHNFARRESSSQMSAYKDAQREKHMPLVDVVSSSSWILRYHKDHRIREGI